MNGGNEMADLLKAMAHPVRLEILRYLLNGPSCATLANRTIGISQPNFSQHLRILTEAGIIAYRRVGTKKCFYICLPELIGQLFKLFEAGTGNTYSREKDLNTNGEKNGS